MPIAYLPFSTTEPRPTPPNDYLQVPTNPREFGAGINQGLETFGAGTTHAGQVFGEIASDDQTNQVVTGLNDINAKFRALQGEDRMKAYPQMRQQAEDLMSQARNNLTTVNQTVSFDRNTRYLAAHAQREMGDLYDAAQKDWSVNVNKTRAINSLNGLSTGIVGGDRDAVNFHVNAFIDARVKEYEAIHGTASGDVRQGLVAEAQRDATESVIRTLMMTPGREGEAEAVFNRSRDLFRGTPSEVALENAVTTRSDRAAADNAIARAMAPGGGAALGGTGRVPAAVPPGEMIKPGPPTSEDPRGMIPVIRSAAAAYGHDPDVAVRVAKSEGLTAPLGDGGKSGGAFQLYTNGGLGNEFQQQTGLDPLDPKNEPASIYWAMQNLSRTGWQPYHGAAKVGIGPQQGVLSGGLSSADLAAGRGPFAQPATGARGPIQLAQSAGERALAGGQPDYLSAIANINADTTMSPRAKREAVTGIHEQYSIQHSMTSQADAAADKQRKDAQAEVEADLFAKAVRKEPLDPIALSKMVQTRQLSPQGYNAIMGEVTRAAQPGQNNWQTVTDLYQRMGQGEDVIPDIQSAVGNGNLKGETAAELMRAANTHKKQETDQVQRTAFSTLRTIAGMDAAEHPMVDLGREANAAQVQLWGQAQVEWNKRVIIGREDPMQVLSDMTPRYGHPVQTTHALPHPRFGAIDKLEDVGPIAQKTQAALNAGQISQDQFRDEQVLLLQYQGLLEADQKRQAAKKAVPTTGGARAVGVTPSP